MPKTRSYCYRLKGYDETICFRLEVGSEAYVLWNYFMEEHRKKKNRIKVVIEEVLKMARDRIGFKGRHATFIQNIMNEVGGSQQKAFDRIFELALEEYLELQHKGQVPILVPHRRVTPRIEPKSQPIERETIKRPQKKTPPRPSLDNVKAWFPSNLKDVLTFEYQDGKAILRTKHKIPREDWTAIMMIVQEHNGKWIRANKESRWEIPLE